MSVFYCREHRRAEDSDYVGCVEREDGSLVCSEAATEDEERASFARMTPSAKRAAMGGEFGGDRADD